MRRFWLLPPFIVGALLRLWNLHNQVVGDDELHLVRTALTQPVGTILTTYQKVDACIPLSALYRGLVESGIRLTELNVRLPALLSGLALLVIAPIWADRRLGRATAIAFAWLLAVSPGLVFYSRIARPYMPAVLLSFVAAVTFDAWWRSGGWQKGALYAALAALAFWLHPVAAPLALSPLVFGAVAVRDRRRALALAALVVATVVAVLAVLVPSLPSFLEVLGAKHQKLQITPAVWRALAQLQAGTAVSLLAGLFWLGSALGLLRLVREERNLGAFTGCLVAGQLAALLLVSPLGLDAPLIFHRYALVIVPWVLLWVALALARFWVLAAVFVAVLFAAGPLADSKLWRSGFPHHDDYLAYYVPRPSPPLPSVYRQLGPGAILEVPWIPVWRVSRAVYLYQEVHGREVVVGAPEPVLSDRRVAFRNVVAATPAGFLASRARWLIVHRDFAAEEDAIRDRRWPPRMGVGRRFRHAFQSHGRLLPKQLRRLWGRPDYADGRVAVWDLERLRR